MSAPPRVPRAGVGGETAGWGGAANGIGTSPRDPVTFVLNKLQSLYTMSIKEVTSLTQLHSLASGTTISVVDFYATWCGPCKTIAPVFQKLSTQFAGRVQFLKVDVDKAQDLARHYSVSAMPTFLTLKGIDKLDQVRGADPQALTAMITKHAPAGGAPSGSGAAKGFEGFSSLNGSLELSQVSCLNEASGHTIRDLLKGGGDKWLESDCDEQLLLHLPFQQQSRVRALRLKTLPSHLPNAPAKLRLFVNRATLGFDNAEAEEATQEIELTEAQVKGEEVVELRFVKFQSVNVLSIFVVDNQGGEGEDVTRIDELEVLGVVREGTDMSQLSKGEDDHEH